MRSNDEIVEAVRECVGALLQLAPDHVEVDVPLLHLGADSYDFIELALRLDEQFSIHLSQDFTIPDSHTVMDFVSAIKGEMAKA